MPLWGNADAANSAPKYTVDAASGARGPAAYGNTTVGAFVDGASMGVFGVDAAEASISDVVVHPGWVVVRQGTGYVDSVAVAVGGTGYSNSDKIVISGGTSNASGTLVTNSTGGVVSAALSDGGAGFVSTTSVSVTNSTGGTSAGSNAVITAALGGRAGRTSMETLVAMGTITGDGSDDVVFPDS